MTQPANGVPHPRVVDREVDYSKLSTAELESVLNAVLTGHASSGEKSEAVQRLMEELQVHRRKLETQNRALRQTQDELQEAVHRYVDLYDSLPIGYVTLTVHGQITEANSTAAEMLHLGREQLVGRFLSRFIAAKETQAFTAHVAAVVQNDERHLLEVTIEPPDRAAFTAQLSSRRVRSGENGVLIRTAVTDISTLKETQSVLQEVIAEQESFVYSVSHDLRAPLVTIIQFSSLLNDGTIAGPDETRDVIDRISRAAARMDALLQTLLEYSRVSRAEPRPESLDLDEVLGVVLLQHQALIKERNAQVGIQTGLPNACGSRCLLIQVLSHLLTNAIKFTPADRAPIVRITAQESERAVVVCVADEGIGIPPHHHERIFRLFERLHGPTTYPGTGIGLALVRRAADKMHARVWVESREGQGSKFFVELPKFGPCETR